MSFRRSRKICSLPEYSNSRGKSSIYSNYACFLQVYCMNKAEFRMQRRGFTFSMCTPTLVSVLGVLKAINSGCSSAHFAIRPFPSPFSCPVRAMHSFNLRTHRTCIYIYITCIYTCIYICICTCAVQQRSDGFSSCLRTSPRDSKCTSSGRLWR